MKNIFNTPLKLILAVSLIFFLNSVQNGNFLYLMIFAIISILLIFLFFPDWKIFSKRYFRIIIIPFFMSVFIPFSGNGNVKYMLNFKIFNLALTDTGLMNFYSVIIKSFFSIAIITAVISSCNEKEIFYSLKKLKVPSIFVMTMFLMYRYIFLFKEEFDTGIKAINARIFKKSYFAYNKKISYLIGNIFIRTFDRAENIYRAMSSRGFDGNFYIEGDRIELKKSGVVLVSFIIVFFLSIRMSAIFVVK